MAITRIGNPAIADQRGINFRNIIINGDMSIAQRGTSTASITSGSTYPCIDRMKFAINSIGTWTVSQNTDVPTAQGFTNSLKLDCTTADASPASGDYLIVQTIFEGQNLQYIKKGTSSAESLTLSFWVKSVKTGTFIAELVDNDNTRSISKSYTISSASTWEKKTITFAGDTTGTLDNDNAGSMQLNLWLGSGSDFNSGTLQTSWGSTTAANRAVGNVNLADSTSNEWYITGVQLEAGQVASDFEFLPVDVNLQRCFRYYERGDFGANGVFGNKTTGRIDGPRMRFHTEKRATPTMTIDDTAGNSGTVSRVDIDVSSSSNQPGAGYASIYSCGAYSSSGSNATGIYGNFKADAEL